MTLRQYFVPGRIELVGKHVDYAGGSSLTCAIDRGLTITAGPLDRPVLRLYSSSHSEILELPLTGTAACGADHWGNYATAVINRLARDVGGLNQGVDVSITSTLPESSGLSSSSALTVGIANAIVDFNQLDDRPDWTARFSSWVERAEYFAAMETGAPFRDFAGDHGVGVAGGAQDHIAILCSRAGACGHFRYMPALQLESVRWPEAYSLAIAVSGVVATKTGNARDRYNRTSHALRALLGEWNMRSGRRHFTLTAAMEESAEAVTVMQEIARSGLTGFPADYLEPRFAQFLEETTRIVPGAVRALRDGHIERFGMWINRSQEWAESGLQNQVPETISLVRSARELGATAASAFGAGFGGAVWSMVPTHSAENFLQCWSENYKSLYPGRSGADRFFLTQPSRAASRLL